MSGTGCGTATDFVSDSFDTLGRQLSTQRTAGGTTRTIAYQYDAAGNRTRTTWPDAYYVTYDYDELNRMTLVRESGSTELARYTYDPLSRRKDLTFAASASNKVTYTYEPDGDLDVLTHILGSLSVALDFGHNRSHQINSVSATDEFYLGRPAASDSVAYQSANRLNQYPVVSGTGYTYDLNGNLLTWTASSGKQSTYTYDSENRLLTAVVSGTPATTVTFGYDPLGRRSTKSVSAQTTTFLSDGDEEIADYSGATLLRRFITGPAVDDRVAMVEGTTRSYFHINHQGSVVAMTDASGSTTGAGGLRIAYDAYGVSNAPAGSVPFRYTGRRFDDETGLYYLRARFYSPQVGRFLQADPMGYKPDLNLYAYVGNDPVSRTDPSGTCGTGLIKWLTGCEVSSKIAGNLNGMTQIDPQSPSDVNGHAISGDGSNRAADFSRVSLNDLGLSLKKYARQPNSPLNSAIANASKSGKPQAVGITGISAGGGVGGLTPPSQQLAIGRFAVDVNGTVAVDAKTGIATLKATVTGRPDVQDYPSSNRNPVGEASTTLGRAAQSQLGGKDYTINFYGSQEISAELGD